MTMDTDAITLAAATGVATLIALALKGLFALAQKLAAKTSTTVDDAIITQAKADLKDQVDKGL
jgi:hypothetical protein